ncbi:N-acetyl-D-glucosamine kinase [Glycine soja]
MTPENGKEKKDFDAEAAGMKRYRNGEIWEFEDDMGVSDGDGTGVLLGLDGGTTSTVCICMPMIPFSHSQLQSLPILARAVAGCSNHNSVGEIAARETIEQVMADALSKCGSKRSLVQAVCLAVSGVNHPTDQQRILGWLRDIFPSHVRLYVRNDAVAALASGTMGKLHGCVLIAGTGSIAYGFTEDGKEARAAGAGPVLGDWGSGYGIAAQALTAVVRAHDGRGPSTMLTSSILQTLGLSSAEELIGWTYADPSWARIAALVPVVVTCAEAGDEVANKILLDSVQELASSVKAVVERLGLCGQVIPLHSLLHLANYVKLNGNKHVAVFPFPFGTHVVPLLNLVLKLSQAAPNCSFSFIGTEKSNAVRFLKPHIPTNIKPYCISDGIPEGHPLANHPIEKLSFSLKMGSGNLHKGLVLGVGVAGARRGFHGVGVAEVRRHGRGCSQLRLHDGKSAFPLVMVGGVLEANRRRWDIGKEVMNCISKYFSGVIPIRPKVEPAVGAAWLAWNFLMKECHKG